MRSHHTKDKGDLGVLHAKVDLAEKGYVLLQPLSEHAPFDLVVYKDVRFLRVSVKYRSAVDGGILLALRSVWADRNGIRTVPLDRGSIDVVCIYCPDTRVCYYVDPLAVAGSIRLRIAPAKNQQLKGVHLASDFTEMPVRLR